MCQVPPFQTEQCSKCSLIESSCLKVNSTLTGFSHPTCWPCEAKPWNLNLDIFSGLYQSKFLQGSVKNNKKIKNFDRVVSSVKNNNTKIQHYMRTIGGCCECSCDIMGKHCTSTRTNSCWSMRTAFCLAATAADCDVGINILSCQADILGTNLSY